MLYDIPASVNWRCVWSASRVAERQIGGAFDRDKFRPIFM
jgi:hypothetical protein